VAIGINDHSIDSAVTPYRLAIIGVIFVYKLWPAEESKQSHRLPTS